VHLTSFGLDQSVKPPERQLHYSLLFSDKGNFLFFCGDHATDQKRALQGETFGICLTCTNHIPPSINFPIPILKYTQQINVYNYSQSGRM
jgi:hypothetical protein